MTRMADAEILPRDFTTVAKTVHTYEGEVEALFGSRRDEAEARSRNPEQGAYRITDDQENPTLPPLPLRFRRRRQYPKIASRPSTAACSSGAEAIESPRAEQPSML